MSTARPDTWMPLYWGDYLRDTGHLGAAEHGAYLLLIGHYWTTGKPLPDDDVLLGRIARMTPKLWKAARHIIAPFFQLVENEWRHKRITQELAKWERLIEAKSNAGQASAAARAQRKEQQTVNTRSTDVATEPPTKFNPSPSPSPPSEPKGSSGETAQAPPRPRASRLAEDWFPNDADRAFAIELGLLPAMVAIEADKFADYWRAKPGTGGTKLDWSATWRNWCRRALETGPKTFQQQDANRVAAAKDAVAKAFEDAA
jgi:uncharacterized protein YdaU (DUF1376 family)